MTTHTPEPAAGAAAARAPEVDELYVGYLPAAPPGYARFVRRLVVALLAFTGVLAFSLAALQSPVDPGTFELDHERAVNGVMHRHPVPRLALDDTGDAAPSRTKLATLLVRPWKHGAAGDLRALDGHRVALRGHRIASPLGEMLELVPGSVVDRGDAGIPPFVESLGRFRLRGELVDSKCYLGVMKPGRGKPHRSCAARCASGGIPLLLLIEDPGHGRIALVVATGDGSPLPRSLLARIGEAVELAGEVARVDGMPTIYLRGLVGAATR